MANKKNWWDMITLALLILTGVAVGISTFNGYNFLSSWMGSATIWAQIFSGAVGISALYQLMKWASRMF